MSLRIEGVRVEIGGRRIVEHIDLDAGAGTFVGMVGPNGSGKSTLLRTVYHALRPQAGLVAVDGADVWRLSARRAAQHTAAVTQEPPPDFDLRVREVVAMGRAPHKGPFDRDNARDEAIIDGAMRRTGVVAAADRWFSTLSGGEKQRVLIARALAQQSRLLVLDEPTISTSGTSSRCSTWCAGWAHGPRGPARPEPARGILRRDRGPGGGTDPGERGAAGRADRGTDRRGVRGASTPRQHPVTGRLHLSFSAVEQPAGQQCDVQ